MGSSNLDIDGMDKAIALAEARNNPSLASNRLVGSCL